MTAYKKHSQILDYATWYQYADLFILFHSFYFIHIHYIKIYCTQLIATSNITAKYLLKINLQYDIQGKFDKMLWFIIHFHSGKKLQKYLHKEARHTVRRRLTASTEYPVEYTSLMVRNLPKSQACKKEHPLLVLQSMQKKHGS